MSWMNTCSFLLVNLFSMFMSLSFIGRILGLLPFSGVMFMVFCCVLMSFHFILVASPILAPVSFRVSSSVAVRVPHDAISWSISVSVGMNGIFSSIVYFGFFHCLFMVFRNCVYVDMNCFFVWFFHLIVDRVVFTCSGSFMLQSLLMVLNIRILGIIVVSSLPFLFISHAKFSISLLVVSMRACSV
jgi:hypothetical protein